MLCPCWCGSWDLMPFDQGWCARVWLIRILQGHFEGTLVSECTLVAAFDFPGPTLSDGNGTARLYLDARTTDEQQRGALEAMFQGMNGLSTLVTSWLPTEIVNMNIQQQ